MPYLPPCGPVVYVHADDHLLVIDKPSGLLSVPGRGPGKADCALARVNGDYPGALTVHRLDMPTSGLLMLARSKPVQAALSGMFAHGEIAKTYIADCWGVPAPARGEINLPLLTDWPNRPRQMVCPISGKPSLTGYDTLGLARHGARLRLTPRTGRSHQIRVHLAAIGHAVLGDDLYAPPDALAAADRLHLHAESLGFVHPVTGAVIRLLSHAPFETGFTPATL